MLLPQRLLQLVIALARLVRSIDVTCFRPAHDTNPMARPSHADCLISVNLHHMRDEQCKMPQVLPKSMSQRGATDQVNIGMTVGAYSCWLASVLKRFARTS